MSFLGKIMSVGRAVETAMSNATGASPREITKVFKDIENAAKVVGNVAKDVGTSATRIVTDTALDVIDGGADLVGQPTNFPEDAKRKMSEAGVISAHEAIEKNHYSFLKEREKQAQAKYDELVLLHNQTQEAEKQRDAREDKYSAMLFDIEVLAQMTIEAQEEFAKVAQLPDWEQWAQTLDLSLPGLQNLSKYVSQWDKVGRSLSLSKTTGGLAEGVIGIGAIAVAAKAAKLSKLGKVAKATKFAKVGKLLGRASGVLAVIGVGLDVGLSFAEFEAKADRLRQYLDELDNGIKETKESIADLETEIKQINTAIDELLHSVSPKQSEATWKTWFEDKKSKLNTLRTQLIDLTTIRQEALKTARLTVSYPIESRIGMITSLDPDITEDEARSIIEIVDQETN